MTVMEPVTLAPQASCVLSLRLIGSQMGSGVSGGPIVCWTALACAQPAPADQLNTVAEGLVSVAIGAKQSEVCH